MAAASAVLDWHQEFIESKLDLRAAQQEYATFLANGNATGRELGYSDRDVALRKMLDRIERLEISRDHCMQLAMKQANTGNVRSGSY